MTPEYRVAPVWTPAPAVTGRVGSAAAAQAAGPEPGDEVDGGGEDDGAEEVGHRGVPGEYIRLDLGFCEAAPTSTDAAVDRLAQQVGVPSMAGRLLDQMQEDPS
jgi:hypothetical protein